MLPLIAAVFGFAAVGLFLLLAGLTLMGWFGLTGKVKELTNKFLSGSFDQ